MIPSNLGYTVPQVPPKQIWSVQFVLQSNSLLQSTLHPSIIMVGIQLLNSYNNNHYVTHTTHVYTHAKEIIICCLYQDTLFQHLYSAYNNYICFQWNKIYLYKNTFPFLRIIPHEQKLQMPQCVQFPVRFVIIRIKIIFHIVWLVLYWYKRTKITANLWQAQI